MVGFSPTVMIRFLLVVLALSASATAQPQLHQLSLSTNSDAVAVPQFDLTGAPAYLVLTVAASVGGGEVGSISITMAARDHFGGVSRLYVPTILASAATVRYPLPRFLETGTYLLNVAVVDTDGYWRRWTSDELAAAGLPDRFEVVAVGDGDPPIVTGVEIAPIADPAQPQGVARFTFRDPSGVLAYRVVIVAPSGRRHVLTEDQSNVGVGPEHTIEVPFDLSSGPQLDGPAEQGYWTIAEIHLTDSQGTSQTVTARDLSNLEIQSRFAVGDVPPDVALGPGCGAPNPVVAGETMRLPASVNVYDVRGRRVAQVGQDGTLSTEGLSQGIYLARSVSVFLEPCPFTVVSR